MLESSGPDWKYIPYSGQVYLYPFFWLTVYCVIIQLFFRLWRPCDCCSPDYWMLALAVGESGGSQLLLLLEGLCGPAPALLFPPPPCLSHSELFRYVFFRWVLFLAFSGALSMLLPLPRVFYPGFSTAWFTSENLSPSSEAFFLWKPFQTFRLYQVLLKFLWSWKALYFFFFVYLSL